MYGDKFVWDEFVGDELLGEELSGSPGELYSQQGILHSSPDMVAMELIF